jgi:hypothetical protein
LNVSLKSMTLDEMEVLYQEAKRQEWTWYELNEFQKKATL